MDVRCSFCNISSTDTKHIAQKGELAICSECLSLVREILEEFCISDESIKKGIYCSFCNREQGGERRVFEGKSINICIECVNEIEAEIKKEKKGHQLEKETKGFSSKLESILYTRVKEGIRQISAYEIPTLGYRIKLDGNESPFNLPEDVLEKVLKELKEIQINRYPDAQATTLRDKISSIVRFPKEGILLGNGSDELIELLMITFSGKTQRVLYPVPTFSMYRIISVALGLEPIEVELDDGFDIDLKAMLREIRRGDPDLIFLASPNNPTGNRFSDEKVFEIINNSTCPVILDEAYCDFSGKTFLPLIEKHENLMVLRSMSKVGFAGIRLGILFGNPRLIKEINKVRLPYNINSLTQKIAEIVLDNSEFVRENIQLIVREKKRVYETLKLMGIEAFPSDANFILFRVSDADYVFRELANRGILIRNFNSPGRLKNCMRVTIGKPEENTEFLESLKDIIPALKEREENIDNKRNQTP